jgi:integrase
VVSRRRSIRDERCAPKIEWLHLVPGERAGQWTNSPRGQKISQVSTKAWRQALGRARIESFRWHDFRHTWASWHVQNGTPLNVLQELGGWESPEMVRRYAHFSAEHLAPYAERLAALRVADVGTDPTAAEMRNGLRFRKPL